MKKRHAATIAAAAGLAALMLIPTVNQAWSADSVTVIRGATAETAPATFGSEGGVSVYRGAATPITHAAVARPEPAPPITMSGEIAWLYDAQAGKLTGCEVIGSLVAGRNAIRCATRTLRRPPITLD